MAILLTSLPSIIIDHVQNRSTQLEQDEALLQHVGSTLRGESDGETFFRMTSIVKSIAIVRPENVKTKTEPGFIDVLMSRARMLSKMHIYAYLAYFMQNASKMLISLI